jgi:hypothetical protein
MAAKKTVTLENLVALGPQRLAAILFELGEGDTEIKRRLRLELAAEAGGDVIAAEIGKRLTSLRTARSSIDWDKARDFARDLDLQRAMIADRVTQTRPDLALDLMWRFMDLAEPVINRVDDSNGTIGDVFRTACDDLGEIAAKANPDPVHLADRVFTAIAANGYGVFDGIIEAMLPALGKAGTPHLKTRLTSALSDRPAKRDGHDWRRGELRRALQDIADGEADVDGYIAQVPVEDRSRPSIAADIGRRLLAANRAVEALAVLESARRNQGAVPSGHGIGVPRPESLAGDWEDAYIAALDATGQNDQAQALRWAAFEERLSATHLRAYLKKLPDFDDIEAEERAMKHALGYRNFSVALAFFTEWASHARAAQLALSRSPEIDGNLYYLLDPAAQAIEGKHPLAATLLRRAMIDDTLNRAKSTRYKHAARHLLECRSLAANILDCGAFETHDAFVKRLQAKHGRKIGFWSLVSG